MTRTLLVAGTASHVGKSTVVAGLCRLVADRGVDVAPYKAQNMSNNARAVPGGEIGISQYTQAKAARIPASTDVNPVLLKPHSDGESQLVVQGDAVDTPSAGTYYDDHWDRVRSAALDSYDRLASRYECVIAEGAGSIAEPNLLDRDLANVETARFADADVLLVTDIDRGGAFASLLGTIELLPADVRERVRGVLVTKFRGDRSILDPAITDFEDRTGVPILGVLPYDDPGLPDEDSVSIPADRLTVRGRSDRVPPERSITVAVPRLSRISNVADLAPLAREPGVRVAYVPLASTLSADALVIPGTKNTVADLQELERTGMADRIREFDGPIVGICGGYQLLGERLEASDVEAGSSSDVSDTLSGVGLLPVATRFGPEKVARRVSHEINGVGPIAGANGTVTGYEIHRGRTRLLADVDRPFPDEGAATERVLGTVVHGVFENPEPRRAFVRSVYEDADRMPPAEGPPPGRSPIESAAALLAEHTDLDELFSELGH